MVAPIGNKLRAPNAHRVKRREVSWKTFVSINSLLSLCSSEEVSTIGRINYFTSCAMVKVPLFKWLKSKMDLASVDLHRLSCNLHGQAIIWMTHTHFYLTWQTVAFSTAKAQRMQCGTTTQALALVTKTSALTVNLCIEVFQKLTGGHIALSKMRMEEICSPINQRRSFQSKR